MTLINQIQEAKDYLIDHGIEHPSVGLILGSGLGELADEANNKIEIPYEQIPHFPKSTVEGHAGQLVYGDLAGKKVLAMQGRFHYYEGYSMQAVTFPVRVMKALGVNSLIITNAAGGVNESFTPGDLMMITDHINLTGDNPLIGPNENSLGARFVDMSEVYNKDYQEIIQSVAKKLDLNLQSGVYASFSGPTYETPSEIRMARTIGIDAVGMSTVPEAIVAKHSGLKVAGLSCITNLAAGMQATLNHEEVVETSKRVKEDFKELIKGIIDQI